MTPLLLFIVMMPLTGACCGLIGFTVGWRGASRFWREEYRRLKARVVRLETP